MTRPRLPWLHRRALSCLGTPPRGHWGIFVPTQPTQPHLADLPPTKMASLAEGQQPAVGLNRKHLIHPQWFELPWFPGWWQKVSICSMPRRSATTAATPRFRITRISGKRIVQPPKVSLMQRARCCICSGIGKVSIPSKKACEEGRFVESRFPVVRDGSRPRGGAVW